MKKRIFSWLMAVAMVMSLLPTAAFATGEAAANTGSTEQIDSGTVANPVAQVGETKYATLAEAVAAGGTITLLDDVTLTETITITDKTVTIQADSAKTITINGGQSFQDAFIVNGGKLTLGSGLSIETNIAVLGVEGGEGVIDGAEITATNPLYNTAYVGSGTLTIKSGSINATGTNVMPLLAYGSDAAKLVVEGGTITTNASSVARARDGAQVEIKGGTLETTCNDPKFCAAYANNGGIVTMSGGTAKAAAGKGLVAATDGTVMVSDGTVDGGVTAHETAGASATISGGTVTGTLSADDGATLSITGGTFSVDPTAYLVEGFAATQSGDTWTVEDNRVAQIGETKYATLAEAVEVGGIITLLKDVTLTETITITDKTVTIQADSDKTITINGDQSFQDTFVVNGGKLTLGNGLSIHTNIAVLGVEGGEGVIDGAKITATDPLYNTVYVGSGTLTIKSGAIDSTGTNVMPLLAYGSNAAKLVVEGGTITTNASSVARARDGAQVEIKGGTLETTCENPEFCVAYANNGGIVTMSGGTAKAAAGKGLVAAADGTVMVSDGTVNGGITAHETAGASATVSGGTVNGTLSMDNGATLTIVGGIFATDPSAYVAEGYAAAQVDGKYIVGADTHTVTFMDGQTQLDQKGINHGVAITKPADPTKDGYAFVGWYTDAALTAAYDFSTVATGDVTLYAKWNENAVVSPSAPEPDDDDDDYTPSSTTTTVKNGDGSTTTITTNRVTGTTTETTKTADGVIGTVVTDKNDEITEITASIPASAAEDANENESVVTLPIAPISVTNDTETAVTVEIRVSAKVESVTVEIPVEDVTPGTVVVLVDRDGKETVVNTTGITENGVVLHIEGNVTVKVVENSKDFKDVSNRDWYSDAADFVSSRGLMNGMTEDIFGHNVPTSRAMVAQILHNMEGKPDHTYTGSFGDVGANDWYADAIHWAAEEGIISGTGNSNFAPNAYVTREQLAVMMWKYAGAEYSHHSINAFKDCGEISSYAEMAIRWAVENGLMSGKGNGQLDPKGNATRAEVASVLMKFYENVKY